MKTHPSSFLVLIAALAFPAGLRAEDGSAPAAPAAPPSAAAPQPTQTAQAEPGLEPLADLNELAARFGWWGVNTSGSLLKIGEYQGLDSSSPFWDIDGIRTDGTRTADFFLTGPESESTSAGLKFYNGPGLTVDLGYERFPHRLDHKLTGPLTGWQGGAYSPLNLATAFPAPPLPAAPPYGAQYYNAGNLTQYAQDINVGQDYAIRVQEFKANFKGNVTENIKWRLNVWGMEKEGYRQADAMAHCYTLQAGGTALTQSVNQVPGQPGGTRCHLISQSQRIHWTTIQIEPVFEFRLTNWLSAEYSRTMRNFAQEDQVVSRPFNNNNFGAGSGYVNNTLAPYALVPDGNTDIDRLKLSAQIGENTDAYMLGYIGNNVNEFRDLVRHFTGADGRITNRSIDGLQITGYGKTYTTETTTATASTGEPIYEVPTQTFEPVNRQFNAFGATSRWKPYYDERGTVRSGLAIINGYEFSQIRRQGAEYELNVVSPNSTPNNVIMENVVFEQPNTDTNKFFVGVTEDWSACFRTLVKYTYIDSRYPLFGVTTGVTNPGPDATLPGIDAYNSALPTHVDRVELGTTWHPVDNLVVNGTLYVEQSTHHSELARFNQNGYPWMVSAWYAPTNKLSLTAGYAELTSWIDQDITLGSQARYGAAGGPHVGEWEVGPSFVAPWRYTGKSEVLNLGAAYAFTERLTLSGGLEYVHGFNGVSTPPSPLDQRPNLTTFTPSPYTEISAASRVNINTYRLSAGVDYWLRDGITVFGRYNFYEYDDITAAYNSGTAHMFLGGVTAAY